MKNYSFVRSLPVVLGFCMAISAMFTACKEEVEPDIEDFGYAYFPLEVGQEWHYLMDSITIIPNIQGIRLDSVRLEVRETVMDTFRDAQNQLWYRGERYDRRAGEGQPWRFRQTFLLGRTPQMAMRQEENLLFAKFPFPPKRNADWNGHSAFDEYRPFEVGGQIVQIFADWDYRIAAFSEMAVVNGQTFDNTLLVEGVDEDNLLSRRFAQERYAPGIGLVYRELTVLETQCQRCCNGDTGQCLDLPWLDKAEAGFIIKQWLVQ